MRTKDQLGLHRKNLIIQLDSACRRLLARTRRDQVAPAELDLLSPDPRSLDDGTLDRLDGQHICPASTAGIDSARTRNFRDSDGPA